MEKSWQDYLMDVYEVDGYDWKMLYRLENNHMFYGRDYLEKISVNGNKKKFVGLEIKGKVIARANCQIFKNDALIGIITSGEASESSQNLKSSSVSGTRYVGLLGMNLGIWEVLAGFQHSKFEYADFTSSSSYSLSNAHE